MRLVGLLVLLLAAQSAMAIDCHVKPGIFVPAYENDHKCAYLVTKSFEDPHTQEPSCGVWVSFIHDPRYLPNFECETHGITLYPIGAIVEDDSTFKDERTNAPYTYYGPTHLKHDDL